MKAMDVMTRQVISVGPETSILEVARLMLQHRISGLPVVDTAGNLVGIVTEGDFLRRTEIGTQRRRPHWLEFILGPGRLASEYAHTSGRKVDEVMTTEVRTVMGDTPLEEVVHLMERHGIKRLPVLCERNLVGIVTRANLFRAVIRLAYEAQPASVDDTVIRERLLGEIKNAAWAPAISVAVKDGIVQLTGLLSDERQRQALRVAAENTPGVKDVKDNLVWIDPTSGLILDGS
jgi:CBS-domain-containing membrane protein